MISHEKIDIFTANKILFIQPHPDDNELFAGGTVAKLVDNNIEVHYLSITNGGKGSIYKNLLEHEIEAIRVKEQIKAGNILGVTNFHWLNYPDGSIYDNESFRKDIVKYIRLIKPDIIFTVDPWLDYETHLDHINTGKVVSFAARTSSNHLFYPELFREGIKTHKVSAIAYYSTSNPNTFINIKKYNDIKFSAIGEHKSQFTYEYLVDIKKHFKNISFEISNKYLGNKQHIESFKILPLGLLHSNINARDM